MSNHDQGPRNPEIVDTPEQRERFRIAVFGTGSETTEQDKQAMEDARAIATVIAKQRFSVATGGYDVGVMQAANDAAVAVVKARKEDPKRFVKAFPMDSAIGGPMQMPLVKDARHFPSATLNERLGHLVDESDGFVVLGGKFGTDLEMLVALHSENVQQLSAEGAAPRPILVVDASFDHLDKLNMFVSGDQKLQSMPGLNHMYFIAGMSGWKEKAERILDLYYRKSLGQILEKDDETWLKQASYKHNIDNGPQIEDSLGYHN